MSRPDILVLGRSGQLATALAERGGSAVLTVGRPAFDLAEPDAIERLIDRHRPAIVINAAAYTAVDRAESEPGLAFAVNRDGPAALARACARSGLALIHVSTDSVFDGELDRAYRESDQPRPINVYGASKYAGECAVLDALPSALVVRTSWIFGGHGESFVSRLLSWAEGRERLTVVGDQYGRPTYAPALAEALLKLSGRLCGGAVRGGVMHVAGASVLSRAEQARIILHSAAWRRGRAMAEIVPVPSSAHRTAAKRPLNAVLDCILAARHGIALGPFEADLETTLDNLLGSAGPERAAS
nr:dTDP-4-dehydrorhamnose reductase [Methylobacterium sp. ZNC0032]